MSSFSRRCGAVIPGMPAIMVGGLAALVLASPAMAEPDGKTPSAGPKLVIENAVGHFVIEYSSSDRVGVTIGPAGSGARDLPVPKASVRDGVTYVRGEKEWRRRSTNCRTTDGVTEIRLDRGPWIAVADLPVIRITAPRNTALVFKDSLGPLRAGDLAEASVSLESCFGVDLGNIAGKLDGGIAGSGKFTAGNAGALEFGIAGSGTATVGKITARTKVSIAGSGDIRIAAVNDATEVEIAGSGNVIIAGGRAPSLSVDIAGSGEVRFAGAAQSLSVDIAGSGDVDVASATGPVTVDKFGSGKVTIAGVLWKTPEPGHRE